MVRLDGKVAMITGGASGIGEASVRLFVESGAKVLIADIQDKRGKRIAEKLGAKYIHLNVSCEEDVITGVDNALSCYGRLDCLFNNAGIAGAVGVARGTRTGPSRPAPSAG